MTCKLLNSKTHVLFLALTSYLVRQYHSHRAKYCNVRTLMFGARSWTQRETELWWREIVIKSRKLFY